MTQTATSGARSRRFVPACCALFVALFGLATLQLQVVDPAAAVGTVLKGPFAKASVVRVTMLENGKVATTQTDARGAFEVPAVIDLRTNPETELADRVAKKDIAIHHQQAILEAIPTKAKQGVAGVRIASLESTGKLNTANPTSITCDGVAVSVGWAPTADILYQAGGRFSYNEALAQLVPTSLPPTVHVAGRVRGIFHWQAHF